MFAIGSQPRYELEFLDSRPLIFTLTVCPAMCVRPCRSQAAGRCLLMSTSMLSTPRYMTTSGATLKASMEELC